jgi:hypothetical protein
MPVRSELNIRRPCSCQNEAETGCCASSSTVSTTDCWPVACSHASFTRHRVHALVGHLPGVVAATRISTHAGVPPRLQKQRTLAAPLCLGTCCSHQPCDSSQPRPTCRARSHVPPSSCAATRPARALARQPARHDCTAHQYGRRQTWTPWEAGEEATYARIVSILSQMSAASTFLLTASQADSSAARSMIQDATSGHEPARQLLDHAVNVAVVGVTADGVLDHEVPGLLV